VSATALRALVLVSILPAILAAQARRDPSPQTPTFRTDVESVDVDVVVTDNEGHVVRGLTADDFEVFEDGVRQEIATFSFVDLPVSVATGALETEPPAEVLAEEGRQFIMILNGYGPRLARIASMFVDTALGPGDRMAIYLNHPVNNAFVEQQPFTASKPLLRAAIRTIEPAFRPFQPTPSLNFNPRQMAEFRRLMELERFEMLKRAMEQIAPTPGRRKAVLWFGGNFPLPAPGSNPTRALQLELAYRNVIRLATRHNVVIYPIDSIGLTTRLGGGELMRMSNLRTLGYDTGVDGVVGTNDYEKGYARILREMSTYYLLGYYPPVKHTDDRFHRITVRVKRPGVSIRAREGYFGDGPPRERPDAPQPPEAVAAALAGLTNSAGRLEVGVGASEESIDSITPAPPTGTQLPAPVLWRRGPLPRESYVQAREPRFNRTERLRLELPTSFEAPVTARLLDRLGTPLPVPTTVSERPDPSGDFRWIVVDLTLAPLAQADYVLEVTQGDSARVIAFRVVP
jgi:VWFA-related protein